MAIENPDAKPPNGHHPEEGPKAPIPRAHDNVPVEPNKTECLKPEIKPVQEKNNLMKGICDILLLYVNANQIQHVLDAGDSQPYSYLSLVLFSLSIIIQIAVGIELFICSFGYTVKNGDENRFNYISVIGMIIITSANVFITAIDLVISPGATN